MEPAETFDHALIGVADLEDSRKTFQRLGFTICPRGKHIGWGTANYCIMFPDDYLELLGIVDSSQFTNNLDTFLADQGEGLLGMCFTSGDIEALGKKLERKPSDLKRLLELPEGTVEPRFRLLHPPAGAMPGLNGFFCQHLTPELMRRPEWLAHANGATGLASVTIAVKDVETAVQSYGNLFGEAAIRRQGDQAEVQLNNNKMLIVRTVADEGLIDLAVRVADEGAAAEVLEQAGVAFTKGADGLFVAPEEACGASITLAA